MKYIYYYLVVLIMFIQSCQSNKDFDGLRPDERLNKQLATYYDQLASAENGWIAYLFPDAGGGYTFKFYFDRDNRIRMYADYDATTASVAKESSYRLRAAQIPSLYFDTYSYIHMLADPDPQISGGDAGKGRYSDFEFSIVSASADSIRMIGNLNKSELLLVRAKATQGENFIQQVYAFNQQKLADFDRFVYYYNKLTVGDHTFQFTLNRDLKTVSFRGTGAIDSITFFTEYATTANGIRFRAPLNVGGQQFDAMQDFNLNIAAGTGEFTLGTVHAKLNNQASVLTRQPQDATSMYMVKYQYFSATGFFMAGQTDVHKLQDIPGYAGIRFIPLRYVDGTDVFYLFYNNGQYYIGPAFKTQIDAQGIMRFTNFIGFDGNSSGTITQDIADRITAFTRSALDPQGFYVYRTGRTGYDLVSIKDSRVWLRFR
ncbi:DUF4302 domain-containing protein [Sphingobacterium sp. BIGb0165]|uniref:DUF4302 domain-containing protein n=1 Tax=Sphingobacterium sp. BIGb0165 TaxID=2940615 RepID=UPI00216750B1|nr:DUF4302 domain-containing protein [Sphingobacterium sp. BIGb0165]MCS4226983.1 hypothetical protein [Sphingobacterium sp. BIGb0165]